MLGEAGKLPEIYSDLEINYFLLRRLLGVKTEVPLHSASSLSLSSLELSDTKGYEP